MKSTADRLMLLGVSLFSACGNKSSSLLGLEAELSAAGGEGERAVRVWEGLFSLSQEKH